MTQKTTIAVLGAGGQLGSAFQTAAKVYGCKNIHFFTKDEVDITKIDSLKNFIDSNTWDYIINCAAYTAVDKAETDIENCQKINVEGCQNLASVLRSSPTRLIHFSSDYIYHAEKGFPIMENVETKPQGVYAKSKWDGECIFRSEKINAMILRVSWIVSTYGNNFVKTMVKLMQERNSISVVNDQYGCITSADELAGQVLTIIEKFESNSLNQELFCDVYNYSNEGIITWYDIAVRIRDIYGFDCKVLPLKSKDYPSIAIRPEWSVLSKIKFKTSFDLPIAHWNTALVEILNKL